MSTTTKECWTDVCTDPSSFSVTQNSPLLFLHHTGREERLDHRTYGNQGHRNSLYKSHWSWCQKRICCRFQCKSVWQARQVMGLDQCLSATYPLRIGLLNVQNY